MIAETQNRSKTPLDYDFTDTEALSRYVTETGRILPRRITGLTARQQRHITKTIKRARNMLLMK
ncbi:MAG: 30S ribosomal protein S18 [Puniceicoccales bacterium]|jgi:small subunit ribosomal protein S18|nr:30S ribosomal protein S18 [Puniceicoccales bacterium]